MRVWTPEHELAHSQEQSGMSLRRSLNWLDLLGLGVGGMVGAGVFVTAGVAASSRAGPAVILSFVVAGFAALLSAFCYMEFAVELPAAGGAFSYLGISLGEFAAFITGANLVLEYVISNAAVARTFTAYLASLLGYAPDTWLFKVPALFSDGFYFLDFPALLLVSLLTLSICYSTKRSSHLNMAMTVGHLALIMLVVAAGVVNGKVQNLVSAGSPDKRGGFLPFGVDGIFDGAAIVYFSFIGFDAVSTMAEEVQNPARNLPIGIAGSVLLVTVLYSAMAAALCMLLPYDKIDIKAPFSSAIKGVVVQWRWVAGMVQVGACLGILTSLLVAMLGQARYLCAIARSRLIPSWLAKVDDSSSTPLRSSLVLGMVTGLCALVVDTSVLLDLISIGTLFVFYMVANALIFRKHVRAGVTNPAPTAAFLASSTAFSLSFLAFWQIRSCHLCRTIGLSCSFAALLASTSAFAALVPPVDRPTAPSWQAPCMPWLAVLSIFVNVFLAGSLGPLAFCRFGAWSLLALLFYVGYGVHSAHDAEEASLMPFVTHS
ncbi:hypothetical protein GOP47_0000523 [Adiantum capillus-veneris]|uniref:Cationic amino acid transporter C-terminal domain-containing protein n=1 Tax=Adiantum capillus-veneris TaxID=13818 RepID=A0A9D4ZQM1_ADICA|nr:hypothetical protein GOP47_0000523 [Adiantum capillus-veneris]